MIPQENEKDLADIPDNVLKALKIYPVETVDEVLKHALTRLPTPVEWSEADAAAEAALAKTASAEIVAH